ncbi:MAG: zf-TFIIB domain-containing protein [Psychrobacter sp.]|nr:zf-TFIIB domain-containing protein [Psychrobacter sp.]
MSLNCYHCVTTPLMPIQLDDTLPALGCSDCRGVYLDLLTYRHWLERQPKAGQNLLDETLASDSEINIDEIDNTENALVCQRCRKFMLKYRINNEHENTINVCHTCDDVWLDSGEWALLKHLNMQDKLTEVMSEPWQQHLRSEAKEQSFKAHYQRLLGEDFARVEDFATWLAVHPKKSEIRHYLSQLHQ